MPVQKLENIHKNARIIFCETLLRRKEQDRYFFNKILWTDECTFTTAGVFNRRNTHFWSTQNPREISEMKFQGRRSLHVWCGILNHQIIGPIFYEGSLTGERYLQFLTQEIEVLLEMLPIRQYFQIIWHQDGAPPHNVRPVVHFLNNRYETWIGRQGTIQWPPNSPDLTPLDAFLWGYLKNKVYAQRSANIEELSARISYYINDLNRNNAIFISNAINKLENDYRECINRNGGHIQQF